MREFRVAFSGDFLDERGESAYGDIGLSLLAGAPPVRYHFLKDQAPRAGDTGYWERFYSMEVSPEHVRDLDGLVVLRPGVKRAALAAAAERLVVIGRSGAGYEKIDHVACTEHDIALFNCPSALDHSTASSALMFMLALAKRLLEQERLARQGRWDLQAQTMGHELLGRTLGIVGLGRSGRELARLVAPFNMRIVAYSPHAEPDQAAAVGARLTTLEEVLRTADFVSLHARLTDASRGLIGAEQLGWMKPTAYLVNVARGGLVDQPALVAALSERRIAGAGLDVFAVEPPPATDPILKLDNVVLTPHWSASTRDVWDTTGRAMAEGILRAAQGQTPENVVNVEVLSRAGFRAKLARFAENP